MMSTIVQNPEMAGNGLGARVNPSFVAETGSWMTAVHTAFEIDDNKGRWIKNGWDQGMDKGALAQTAVLPVANAGVLDPAGKIAPALGHGRADAE